jgi:hypothetical protein
LHGTTGTTKKQAIYVSIALVFFVTAGHAQIAASGKDVPPPGSIRLLPGYHHRETQGIDSRTGVIWKENGPIINYDIGEMAGNYTKKCNLCDWTKDEVWRRKQLINGQTMVCVFTKKKNLIVSFPTLNVNFYAKVSSESDLADVLLMLTTFDIGAQN